MGSPSLHGLFTYLKLVGQSVIELSVVQNVEDQHDLWPTDLNINKDHLIIKDYLSTKFEASGGKVSFFSPPPYLLTSSPYSAFSLFNFQILSMWFCLTRPRAFWNLGFTFFFTTLSECSLSLSVFYSFMFSLLCWS